MEDRGWIGVDGRRWRWGENWAAEMMQTRGPVGAQQHDSPFAGWPGGFGGCVGGEI